ncbi:MAG: thiamine-phosphate kinase [Bacillota bacterium]
MALDLSSLGEFGLIELLSRSFATDRPGVVKGIGDDAAVLQVSGENWLLFTTDMLVEEIHFSFLYAAPEQVGFKALVANISDIAAMGGWPTHALISLGVPLAAPVKVLEGIYAGFKRAADEYGVSIVGGDTVRSPARLIINVALLGAVEAGRAIYRSGARPGDLLFVTGTLGNSAAGLYLCRHPGAAVSPETAGFLRSAHLEPRARVSAGRVLAKTGKVTALDDISDGLASELHEICLASGVGCRIREAALPVDPRVREAAGIAGCDPLDWALYGGEDYELVFAVPPGSAGYIKEEMAANREGCYLIGEVLPGEKGVLRELPDNRVIPLEPRGYDHFRIKREPGE